MARNICIPSELGSELRARREALGLSKLKLANKAGKVREVIYRLEEGQEASVSSLLAVVRALGLVVRLEQGGMPTAEEVARAFREGADDEECR